MRRRAVLPVDRPSRKELTRTWPADRVERRLPRMYQRASTIEIRRCSNPFCRHWTSATKRACTVCHTELS